MTDLFPTPPAEQRAAADARALAWLTVDTCDCDGTDNPFDPCTPECASQTAPRLMHDRRCAFGVCHPSCDVAALHRVR